MLRDIEPETILFLSKLKEIQIRSDTGNELTILKDDSKAPLVHVLIEGKKQGESLSGLHEFLVYTRSFDKPKDVSHEKRIGIKQRDVSIAFPLDEHSRGAGKLFAYLPVRSDTGLPFLINADFILTSSREDIQKDEPWNRWLMECVGELLSEALPQLKKKKRLSLTLLESLASRAMEIAEDNIFSPVAKAIRKSLMTYELLPVSDGTFVSAKQAKLAGSDDLRKLLTVQQLNTLLGHDGQLRWLVSDITERRTPQLWRYLKTELGMEEIDADKFARLLTNDFLEKQGDDWFARFYSFLVERKALWREPLWQGDRPGILRWKKILRLEDGSLVEPFDYDGRPNAYLPPEEPTKFHVVRRAIVKDENALEFLKRLGLEEPDEVANVIENILPRYSGDGSIQIDGREYESDLQVILRALKSDSQKKKERLLKEIQETPLIKAENAVTGAIKYKRPDEVYSDNVSLRIYFEGNDEAWFVAEDPAILKRVASELGVPSKVRIRFRKTIYSGHVSVFERYGWHVRGLNGFDPVTEVDGLEFAVTNPSVERAKVIWNDILVPHKQLWRGTVEEATKQDYSNAKRKSKVSPAGALVINSQWIPCRDGGFCKPSEIRLEDLPDNFTIDEILAENLGFKRSLAEHELEKFAEAEGISHDLFVRFLQVAKLDPEEVNRLIRAIEEKHYKFPQQEVHNRDRRRQKIREQVREAPSKQYDTKEWRVRTSRKSGKQDIDINLRDLYTNEDGIMVCQICRNEMPFKGRDGRYYFERVEAFDIPVEHEANYLALCPVCAAMYTEFIKNDPEAWDNLKRSFKRMDDLEVSLRLGEVDTSIRFVESHRFDLRTVLEETDQLYRQR